MASSPLSIAPFEFPIWYRGPRDVKVFFTLIYEIRRFKTGHPSMVWDFNRGDPLPKIGVGELETWINRACVFNGEAPLFDVAD